MASEGREQTPLRPIRCTHTGSDHAWDPGAGCPSQPGREQAPPCRCDHDHADGRVPSRCPNCADCQPGREQTGWVKPKHDCMDTLNRDPRRKDEHAGTVWRCECGKAWRVHGFLTWRLRRYDAKRATAREQAGDDRA